jgi:hypothetical protein
MGQKRGRAEGSFVRETSAQAVEFYRDLVQNLKPWHAPAPKLRTEPESRDGTGVELTIVPAWVGEESPSPGIDQVDDQNTGSLSPATARDTDTSRAE